MFGELDPLGSPIDDAASFLQEIKRFVQMKLYTRVPKNFECSFMELVKLIFAVSVQTPAGVLVQAGVKSSYHFSSSHRVCRFRRKPPLWRVEPPVSRYPHKRRHRFYPPSAEAQPPPRPW